MQTNITTYNRKCSKDKKRRPFSSGTSTTTAAIFQVLLTAMTCCEAIKSETTIGAAQSVTVSAFILCGIPELSENIHHTSSVVVSYFG